jgi:predicted RNA methylase
MIPNLDMDSYDRRVSDPAWTPGKRDILELFKTWGRFTPVQREQLLAKVTKLDAPASKVAMTGLVDLGLRWRSELTRPVLKSGLRNFGQNADPRERKNIENVCRISLEHSEPRIRKAAAQAIGSSWVALSRDLKSDLLAVMKRAVGVARDPSEIKAITDALGKSGDQSALELLRTGSVQAAGKTAARSIVKLTRDLAKSSIEDGSEVCPDLFVVGRPMIVRFRSGLEKLALNMPLFADSKHLGDGVLHCDVMTWNQLKQNFLWRDAGFLLTDLKELTPDSLLVCLRQYCGSIIEATKLTGEGCVRIRLGRSPGVTRSFLWEFAEKLMAMDCGLINDGRDPHWEMELVGRQVILVPRKYKDERFSWRSSQVDGSSDPTIAAAIVTMAEIKVDETVYDPFCGAGTEIILANRMTGAQKLFGTDIDGDAITAARESLRLANVTAVLQQSDASKFNVRDIHVVISNPPFGMRTVRGGARDVLEAFFASVAPRMSSGGRLVILSHAPSSTRRWAHTAGLDLKKYATVRLGRMECELQCFVRP